MGELFNKYLRWSRSRAKVIYRHLPCPSSAEHVEEVLQLLLSDARIVDALNRKKKKILTILKYLNSILRIRIRGIRIISLDPDLDPYQ